MTWHTLLPLASLAASITLLVYKGTRTAAIVALVASAIECLISFNIVSVSVRSLPVWLVLGSLVAVSGLIGWAQSSGKVAVSAATVIALTGVLQVAHFFIAPH